MGSRSKIEPLYEWDEGLLQWTKTLKRRNPICTRTHFKFERPPKILICRVYLRRKRRRKRLFKRYKKRVA